MRRRLSDPKRQGCTQVRSSRRDILAHALCPHARPPRAHQACSPFHARRNLGDSQNWAVASCLPGWPPRQSNPTPKSERNWNESRACLVWLECRSGHSCWPIEASIPLRTHRCMAKEFLAMVWGLHLTRGTSPPVQNSPVQVPLTMWQPRNPPAKLRAHI